MMQCYAKVLIFTSHMQTELKALKAKKKHQENALMAELQVGLHAFCLYYTFCVAELLQTCMYPLSQQMSVIFVLKYVVRHKPSYCWHEGVMSAVKYLTTTMNILQVVRSVSACISLRHLTPKVASQWPKQ